MSPDGATWKEALVADRHDGRLAVQGLRSLPAGGAPASSILFTPGGDGTVSIYRTDTPSGQNPRTATIDSIAADIITLSAPVADTNLRPHHGGCEPGTDLEHEPQSGQPQRMGQGQALLRRNWRSAMLPTWPAGCPGIPSSSATR